MSIFMGKHTNTAVLRLNGVLANPVIALTHLDAAKHVKGRAGSPDQVVVGIPAMTPDGPIARSRASFIAHASVHRLEGINVAIRFIKVSVAIVIVAIPDVKLA